MGCPTVNAPSSLGSSTGTADGSPVFVITGPSGAGKGTLIKALLERVPDLEVAISATTRHRRPGEEDGREYWFLTDAEFARRVHEGDISRARHVRLR